MELEARASLDGTPLHRFEGIQAGDARVFAADGVGARPVLLTAELEVIALACHSTHTACQKEGEAKCHDGLLQEVGTPPCLCTCLCTARSGRARGLGSEDRGKDEVDAHGVE